MFFVLAIFTTENRTDRALFIMCLLKISLLESSLLYVLRTGFLRHKILRDCTASLPCGMGYVVRVFCIFQPETREKRSSRIKAFKPETISAESAEKKGRLYRRGDRIILNPKRYLPKKKRPKTKSLTFIWWEQ